MDVSEDESQDESMGDSEVDSEHGSDSEAGNSPVLHLSPEAPPAWHSIIGASGLLGADAELEYHIRYAHDGVFSDDNCWLVSEADFDAEVAKPHPKIDRASLGWDESAINKEVLVYWNKPGFSAWYGGKIAAYDPDDFKHTIEWDDGDRAWRVNLMACKKCKQWRFVQPDEDKHKFLEDEDEDEDEGQEQE